MIKPEYIAAGGIILFLLLPKKGTATNLVPQFCAINPATTASTEHFKLSEFHSNDGVDAPVSIRGNIQRLMQQLEIIRAYFDDNKVHINRGYSTPEHNATVGGEEGSFHQCGMAADFWIEGYTANEVQEGILNLMESGFIIDGGLGRYNGHTHYDIGPSRRWDNRN